MRTAAVFYHGVLAGYLIEERKTKAYRFVYDPEYDGQEISAGLPRSVSDFHFDAMPPFFDGLLPEGMMLEGLLKARKIDRNDLFSQLMATGEDLVGAVTVEEVDALPNYI